MTMIFSKLTTREEMPITGKKTNKYWSSGIYLMWLLDSVARFFFIQLIYFCLIVCSIIFHVLTIFLGYCLPIPMDNLNIINNTLGKKRDF